MDQNLPLQTFATWTLFGLAVRLFLGKGFFTYGGGSMPVSLMLDAATWPHVAWLALVAATGRHAILTPSLEGFGLHR